MRRRPPLQEWVTWTLALIRTLGNIAVEVMYVMPHSERLIQILRAVPVAANAILRAIPAKRYTRKNR
jgi:hypothetical protein